MVLSKNIKTGVRGMEMIGMVLLFLMIIADTIRAFKDDDGFDGVMLLVRPIVVLVVALLCGEPFWVALLWAIGWGILGFIISILLSEYLGAVLNENNVIKITPNFIYFFNIISPHKLHYILIFSL